MINYKYNQAPNRADLDELIGLFTEFAYWPMPLQPSDWEKLLANTPLFIIARDDDKIIGFARLLTDFVRWAQLYDVLVHKDYQRTGIGRSLIKRLIEHDSISTVRNISLSTLSDRSGFYESLGFSRLSTIGSVESFSLVRKDVGILMTTPNGK